jgi:hypothetical protein
MTQWLRILLLPLVSVALLSAISCNRQKPSEQPKQLRLGYFANLSHRQAVRGVS